MDSEFSDSQNACFIVQDSQEESEFSQMNTSKMLLTLSALKGANMSITSKDDQRLLYSPRKSDMPQSQGNPKVKGAATGSQTGQDDNPQHPGGDGHGEGGSGGSSGSGEAGGGGAGGDGNGGGGDNGGGDGDDDGEDDEQLGDDGEVDEEHIEEGTPSTSGGSSGSVPPLMEVEVGQQNVPFGVQEHVMEQQQQGSGNQSPELNNMYQNVQNPASSSASTGVGGGISDATTTFLSSDGGISDAAIAVVGSDTDLQGAHTSPGNASLSSPRRPAPDISSAHSTLSSFTSSSSDAQVSQLQLARKRLLPRRLHQPSKKQKILDESTTASDTSARDTTSSSSKKDTTTTTSDTSHDTSKDTSHDIHEQSHDQDQGGHFSPGSQEDLFDDNDADKPGTSTGGTKGCDSNVMSKSGFLFATPSEKIATLQFSGQQKILAAESIPDDESPDEVPPSQNVFEYSPPSIIPSTPTTTHVSSNKEGEKGIDLPSDKHVAKKSESISSSSANGTLVRSKSLQEWQPSYQSLDSSSRSRPPSSALPAASLDKQNCGVNTDASLSKSGQNQHERSSKRKNMTEPIESQLDLEITSIDPAVQRKTNTQVEDSVVLNLQFGTETDTCNKTVLETQKDDKKITEVSSEDSSADVILLEPEKTVIRIDSTSSSKSEEQKQSNDNDVTLLEEPKNAEESSQGLALHLSQSQNTVHSMTAKKIITEQESSVSPPCKPMSQQVSTSIHVTSQASTQGNDERFQLNIPKGGALFHPSAMLSPEKFAEKTNKGNLEVPDPSPAQPSLTLDMIDTVPEDDSFNSAATGAFTLYRPSLLENPDAPESEKVSVFSKAKEIPTLVRSGSSKSSKHSDADPYDYSESKEVQQQIKFTSLINSEKEAKKEKLKEMLRQQQTQEEYSEIIPGKKSNKAKNKQQPVDVYEENTEEMDVPEQPDTKETTLEESKFRHMLGQATMEYEDDDSDPTMQESGVQEMKTDKEPGEKAITAVSQSKYRNTDKGYIKSSEDRSSIHGKGDYETTKCTKKSVGGKNEKNSLVESNQFKQSKKQGKDQKSKDSKPPKEVLSSQSREIKGSGERMKDKKKESDVGYKILHHLGETPRSHHKRKPIEKAVKSQPLAVSSQIAETERICVSDPYEYRLSQSERDNQDKESALNLKDRARMKADFQMLPDISKKNTVAENVHKTTDEISERYDTAGPSIAHTSSTGGSEDTTGHNKSNQTSKTTKRQSSKSSHSTEGSINGNKEDKVDHRPKPVQQQSSCSVCGQRSFHTIKVVTTTEIIEERIGGKIVNRKVINVKSETFSQDDESWNSPSPSRTVQSLTSGDLGDISSFSGLGQASKHRCTFESSRSSIPSSVSFGSLGKPSSSRKSGLSRKSSSLLSKSPVTKDIDAVNSPDILERKEKTRRQTSTESDTVPISDAHMLPSLQSAQVPPPPKTSESSDSKKKNDDSTGIGSEFSCPELKLLKKTSSSSKHLSHQISNNDKPQTAGQSESLFSTVDESEPQKVTLKKKGSLTKTRSRSSTSNAKFSESLFSTVSSEMEHHSDLQEAESVFVKPGDIPSDSAKGKSSDASARVTEKSTSSESEYVPATDTEISYPYKEQNVSYINKEMPADVTLKDTPPSDEDNKSPEIPLVAERNSSIQRQPSPQQMSSTSSNASQKDIICLPPYWPTELVPPGTSVLAMWKDKHYYPGYVVAVDKIRNKDVYQILFEDDTQRNVKPGEVIVCDLLAIGQKCMAENEDGWNVPCTVTGHHMKKDVKSCIVKFEDGSTEKVARKRISLNKAQVQDLVTATVASVLTSTDRDVESELSQSAKENNKQLQEVDSTVDILKNSAKSSNSQISTKKKTRGEKSKKAPPIKDDTVVEKMEEEYEFYNPTEAHLPPVATALGARTPVFAKWKDKHYYPGYVQTQKDTSSCREYVIEFEDGDVRTVKTDDLFVCDLLKLGQSVLAERNRDEYEPAIVLGHWKKGESIGYNVEFDDQVNCRVPRTSVILSEDQANTLIDKDIKPFSTPKPSAADVSLENLVEGKRTRALKLQAKESSQSKLKSSQTAGRSQTQDAEKGGFQVPSTSGIYSTGAKKRKLLGSIEPKYHSTPTPNKRRAIIVTDEEHELGVPSPVGALVDSPVSKRKTRKVRHELFSEVKGPIPPAGSKLFQGMIFLLSHVDKSEEEQKKEKEALRVHESVSTTDESAAEEEPVVPYDKEHLIQQIEGGGGTVIQKLEFEVLQKANQCYLVSDTYQRTLKYLTCLALAKPCVSHVWIKDSCVSGILQDYRSYVLPAGLCIEANRLVELPRHPFPLSRVTLMISSQNPRFITTWQGILEAAGARLLDKLPERQSHRDRITAVVTDNYVSANVVVKADELNIPVLSSEWIIQSVINGKVMTYHGHPRYKYNYYEKDADK